ncbi:MAG: OmpH family outer membrane protein [Gemmatimonadales bacterium]|nr:OmpH family outer membrane protein [Gemmatimonadales bacterium]
MLRLNSNHLAMALALLILVPVVLPTSAAIAEDYKPMAIVDSQRIAEEYEAARDAQEQYEKFLQELKREVEDKETELAALVEEIESQKMLLGEDALATKMQAFEKKRADYFQFRDGIDVRAESEYKAKITPILDQIKTIVERLGKEKKFGLIIDSASLGVLFIESEYDLTDDVLLALAKGGD